ncbi:hypothetical protein [Moraxella lacunata]|uniref:hypothetical protein n=1 Tax=Moraxella lacunata TaxID=477 RepID=UPI003EE324F1
MYFAIKSTPKVSVSNFWGAVHFLCPYKKPPIKPYKIKLSSLTSNTPSTLAKSMASAPPSPSAS